MDKEELIQLKGAEEHYFGKRAVRIISLVSAILLAVLFSVAFALDFEVKRAMFKNGSVLADTVFYASLILPAVIFIITPILVKKQSQAEGTFPKENEYISYYTLDNGFVKILRICISLVIAVEGVVRAVAAATANKGILSVAGMLLLSLCLALYFVPEITEKLGAFKGRVHTVFGMVSLLWFLLNIIGTYTQRDFALSSDYFVLAEVGYVLAMLALTYEMRYHLDGGYLRTRLATSCAAFTFGFGLGFGRLVMLMACGQVSLEDTATAVTMLAVSLYFGARIFFYEED